MTSLLPDVPAARECELAHSRLAERLEDVQGCLTEEIGRTMVIARTQRHLFGKVVMARIAQDDHLEEEEAFVLLVMRRQLSDAQQFAIVRHLLGGSEAGTAPWRASVVVAHRFPGARATPRLCTTHDRSWCRLASRRAVACSSLTPR